MCIASYTFKLHIENPKFSSTSLLISETQAILSFKISTVKFGEMVVVVLYNKIRVFAFNTVHNTVIFHGFTIPNTYLGRIIGICETSISASSISVAAKTII